MPPSSLSRRSLLVGALGIAAASGLSGCVANNGPAPSTAAAGSKADIGEVEGTLRFAFWGGSDGENTGFARAKKGFEARHPKATIELQTLPYDGFFSGIDRGILSKTAPDVFRVDYTSIGKYTSHGVLLDMTPYLTAAESSAFLPALYDAVRFEGRTYGVPHQTDTSAIAFSRKALDEAGIGAVPDRLEDAWTWDEFAAISTKLRGSLPDDKYPFAYDWTAAGAYRWASFVYQAGGSLLTPSLRHSAVDSDAGRKAMAFTQRFFDERWVPANNTIKTTVYSDNFFLNQTVAMTFIGDFLVPELADGANGYQGGDWATTYMPRDRAAASDLGGNALVATRDTANPELAAAFLKYMVEEDPMRDFCQRANELPTLQSLADTTLDYAVRPDVMDVFTQQATTITETAVRETVVPGFASVNTALQDQLELAFHGRSTDDAVKAIDAAIDQAVAA
ncbi:sugar ABC transporter substrate-binding protein [Curtobacterium sp. MCLR17_007]|uniref:ABC transporter substrate-binding protein n=1 Tax=Curtobacterium sp. MCLR17_007 TaxID=2175648 RepID=UPI0015E8B654|nr:sugar ABC transporter substrate-binding protein [Curtobacterium sp. MCLR17_007]WIB61458.1 sugar ABC transporter substrate-binding protein [Curtobacterium sp. MCLR17_007]